jgi:hypothetical protein
MKINSSSLLLPAALFLFLSCHACGAAKSGGKVKFHPGHYVAVGPSFDLAGIRYLDDPAVQGVNKRYYWRLLEPEKGVYDFSSVEEDLNYLAAHDKQLIVFIIDRTFWARGAIFSGIRIS